MEGMKIYVAGPMRGYPLFNFPAFDEATAWLREQGHEVRSPAEHDRESGFDETKGSLDGFDITQAFRWDMEAVLWADALVLLPGWRSSVGAGIETSIATTIGTKLLEWHPGGLVRDLSDSPSLEAHDIVNGPRRASYGHPREQFARVAKLWETILGVDFIDPNAIGLCMIAFKISREMNAHSRDNLVDIAGYAETIYHAQKAD